MSFCLRQLLLLCERMKVIVMRGISGAGKSTWVKKHYPDAVVASADDYFRKPDGAYVFDETKLQEAHIACMRTFLAALQEQKPLIVVDNSNVTAAEISPYVLPAKALGYEVEILTLGVKPETAIARKDWLTPQKVRGKAALLSLEEKRFPRYLKDIHRIVENE